MRLINTKTLQLQHFKPPDIPKYAILSHRWGEDEATFEDFVMKGQMAEQQSNALGEELREKAGYRKARSFCEIAHARGLPFAWVDTCCINKRSDRELSEAINSMAKWYRQADVCIVHLADVTFSPGRNGDGDVLQQLEESEWFMRGWTLQELLCPRRLIFYSASWDRIGSLDKDDSVMSQNYTAPLNLSPPRRGFLTSLERACRIKIDDLCIIDQYQSASVAQRMFWASHRRTTKEEDMSYSIMTVFDISMPIIYGEGSSKTFRRLQREIMKNTADESVFAWASRSSQDGNLLATSPSDFSNSNDIERTPVNLDRALVVNSNGIDIYRESDELCIFRRQTGQYDEQLLFIIRLGCERNISGHLSDPCVVAFRANMRHYQSNLNASDDDLTRSPITIQRRMISQTLSAADMSRFTEQGFELVQTPSKRKYHFWLPFENISPGSEEKRRLQKRRRFSRL